MEVLDTVIYGGQAVHLIKFYRKYNLIWVVCQIIQMIASS